jgi:predicted metal-dependent phosphoesterase TrpH
MKIDIHTHTKKCKSGDAPTRAISPREFCDTILSTDVRIVAITNHNVFDLDQYKAITTLINDEAQVWPGIELDIDEDESRGHLLAIVSPALAEDFAERVATLTSGTTPDSFFGNNRQSARNIRCIEPALCGSLQAEKTKYLRQGD